ncbi:DUF397 domain-containing protein [Streptomyces sp. NPDC101213]|uniref:DUF397 domain-containing protein n=1 Tax=Streptomyces sp. NPDC101213 TaxID=3366130 RepID=UPI003809C3C9
MSSTRLAWFKSPCRGTAGDNRVEAAVTGQAVRVRNSKDVVRPCLAVRRNGWARFAVFAVEA